VTTATTLDAVPSPVGGGCVLAEPDAVPRWGFVVTKPNNRGLERPRTRPALPPSLTPRSSRVALLSACILVPGATSVDPPVSSCPGGSEKAVLRPLGTWAGSMVTDLEQGCTAWPQLQQHLHRR
jgi:hypothetical protein